MLLWVAVFLLAVWVVGFLIFHAGAFIHIAVLAAVVFIVWHLASGRMRAH